jgi:hypothetical protein
MLTLADHYMGTSPLKDTLSKPLTAESLANLWVKGHKRKFDAAGIKRFKEEYDPLKPIDTNLYKLYNPLKG